MRPLAVGPSPVITPSRTTARARAAVLRQEICEGSTTPTGSASLSAGADIGTVLFSVSCSGPACSCGRKRGVNDSKHASRVFQAVLFGGRLGSAGIRSRSHLAPAPVRRANGNIGASGLCRPLWFFHRRGAERNNVLSVPRGAEGHPLLRVAIHLGAFAPIVELTNSAVTRMR